jgi:hypothetical protein
VLTLSYQALFDDSVIGGLAMRTQTIINIFFLISTSILGGCAQFLERRSFIDEMNRDDTFFMAGRDFKTVPGDSGVAKRSESELMARTPASYRSKEEFENQRSLEQELQRREAGLAEHELLVYQQAKSVLPTVSERIYYLNLSSYERHSYLQMRMSEAEPYAYSPKRGRTLSLIEQREMSPPDLRIGMDKHRVVNMMGRPSRVDIAGDDPYSENERWMYNQNGLPRYVYFEGGEVHGWTFR